MYKTEQENFWAEQFGDDYIARNQSNQLLASNLSFFSKALNRCGKIKSCIEFGANIGMNLKAINLLYPEILLKGIEINVNAADILKNLIGENNVIVGSIFDKSFDQKADIALIKGVLIHINPEMLSVVYERLYESSNKYILIAEYYNPTPVTINYRGHSDRLFKRDFAGEFMDIYKDCKLIDYGFSYHRDPAFPQDDITWFLIEK
jgi:pseudaminic acid biosynthesis-associated methylase